MTNLSDLIASPGGSRLKRDVARVERSIRKARAALWWERVWPALWPAIGIMAAFLAAGLLNLFDLVPWGIHTLLLLGAFGASGYFFYENFKDFRSPSWEDGARRVEHDSVLEHRPITEQRDRQAVGVGDAYAEALWRAHIRAMLARIGKLRVKMPSPKLSRRDPYYLRFAVLILLIAGFAVAGSQWKTRLILALTPDAGSGSTAATVDAWINPPAYTGLPPIYLKTGQSTPIAVPAGSELVTRVHRSSVTPDIALYPANGQKPVVTSSEDEYAANTILRADERVFVRAGGRTLGNWQIKVIPDAPPRIAFSEPPSQTKQSALKLAFTASDDYGVVSVRALIRPLRAKSKGVLAIDLPLDASAKTVTQTAYRDLTENPFAGLPVEITLEAKDGAGQIAISKPMKFTLPARVFTDPLARALVEQRQNLSVDAPHARPVAAATINALTLAPEQFYPDEGQRLYLILRGIYWALENTHDASDIVRVQDMLWQTAMALDGNGAASAAEQLRAIQQLLTQALAQGASQEVIDALMQRYQEAMQRYLEAMAKNAQAPNAQTSQNAQVITQDDIDKLLKMIQQLAQSGSREAAAQMLAMLQNLLENMQMSQGSGGGGQGDKATSDAIQGLSDLMGRQRNLMDKTYRQGQDAGDPKDGGAAGLAQQQGKLRDDLNKLLGTLGKKGGPSAKALGDAGKSMGDAQGQLGSKSFDGARQSEQDALEAMRKGAGALAKTLLEQSGQNGQNGKAGNEDPLGREQGARGGIAGSGVKIPDKDSLQRARDILEELRKRAGERGRPKEELDYLDRLLKEF